MINTILFIILGALLLFAYLRLRQAQAHQAALRTQLDALQVASESQRQTAEQRMIELNQSLQKVSHEATIGERVQQTLHQQIDTLQKTLSEKETSIDNLQLQLSERRDTIDQQNSLIERMTTEKEALQGQLICLQKEIDKLRLAKPCPRSILHIEGNLVTTEHANTDKQPLPDRVTQLGQEIEPVRTEGSQYPYFMIEQNHTPVVEPITIQQAPMTISTCLLRDRLRESLQPYPEIELLESVALPVKGQNYSFVPGVVLYLKPCHLYVNVEIDAPYSLITRTPAHYVGRTDLLRNLYFVESGWAVCHFAERQLIEQPQAVVASLHQLLAHLANEESLLIEEENELEKLPRWSYKEAELMEQRQVREQYLRNAQIEPTELSVDPFEGERPTIDILPDRTATLTIQCAATEGHPYTKISVRTNNNEYLFETGTQQLETNYFEKGWRVKDIVEKQEVFVPFSDIVTVTPLDDLWLHTSYDQTSEEESREHVSDLIREAVLAAHPIAITYKNNAGETHDRDVLYLAQWITNNKTGQDYTYNEALPLQYHQKFLDTNWSYFTGYCNLRHASRVFLSQNIQRIAVYNCHKSCYSFGPKDLLSSITSGQPDIALLLYSSFNSIVQQWPTNLIAYAYALVQIGRIDEALHIFQSHNKDFLPYPTMDTTWQQAIQTGIAEYIGQAAYKEKFMTVVEALRAAGWDITAEVSANDYTIPT